MSPPSSRAVVLEAVLSHRRYVPTARVLDSSDEARKLQRPGLRWGQASASGGCPPESRGAGPLDAAACDDGQLRVSHDAGGRSPWRLGTSRRCRKRSTGCVSRSRSCARPGSGSSWPPTPTAAGSSATCTTACSSTSSRSRSTCSSRARLVDADPAAAQGAPRRDGARRAAGAGRDGAACAADLPAAARGGRPRRGAALGGGERRHPVLRRGRSGRELPARGRGGGLLVLSRGARARRRRRHGDGRPCETRTERVAFEVVADG